MRAIWVCLFRPPYIISPWGKQCSVRCVPLAFFNAFLSRQANPMGTNISLHCSNLYLGRGWRSFFRCTVHCHCTSIVRKRITLFIQSCARCIFIRYVFLMKYVWLFLSLCIFRIVLRWFLSILVWNYLWWFLETNHEGFWWSMMTLHWLSFSEHGWRPGRHRWRPRGADWGWNCDHSSQG